MQFKLSKSQWQFIGKKAGWSATNEDFPNAGKKCPKCNEAMRKHSDPEKAKKGYKNCPKCNTTYSPESQTKQASIIKEAKCDQCEMLSINGVPCHEKGCPNQTHECKGCNAKIPMNQKYCEDCR